MRYPLSARRGDAATSTSPLSLFDKFFSEFFTDRDALTAAGHIPPVNVAETDSELRFEFELPGVEERDIDLEVHGNQLLVKAQRELRKDDGEYHAIEHHYGAIARRVLLPRGLDTDSVQATFKNGVLRVTVNKTEPVKARKVEIRAE